MSVTVEEAKAVLKNNGYFVDNLWHVDDVQSKFDCTEEEAQEVLYKALTNDVTMEQIWFAIDIHSEAENLPKYRENFYLINGFFKDDKTRFSDFLVYEYDSIFEEDEDIFYYGLSENDIIEAIKEGWRNNLDFVITSYKKVVE